MAGGQTVFYVVIPSPLKVIVKSGMDSASWMPCVVKPSPCIIGRPGSGVTAGGRLTFPPPLGWLGRQTMQFRRLRGHGVVAGLMSR